MERKVTRLRMLRDADCSNMFYDCDEVRLGIMAIVRAELATSTVLTRKRTHEMTPERGQRYKPVEDYNPP